MCFLGVPLALEKTFLPVQVIVFLGLEFDSVAEVVRLPEDKLERCREGISRILKSAQPSSNKKRACTLRELQSILGLLSFACSVIIPGRAFLKRLFALTAGIKNLTIL